MSVSGDVGSRVLFSRLSRALCEGHRLRLLLEDGVSLQLFGGLSPAGVAFRLMSLVGWFADRGGPRGAVADGLLVVDAGLVPLVEECVAACARDEALAQRCGDLHMAAARGGRATPAD